MKIKTLLKTFDSDIEPIMLSLSDKEKELISGMGEQTKFAVFPSTYNVLDRHNFMKEEDEEMATEILQKGKKVTELTIRRFRCLTCDCVFKADNKSYFHDSLYNLIDWYAGCPDCGNMAVEIVPRGKRF